ncbi:dephospho-CoA kinase [Perkinsela sp. CCAP 1560/4]|nr:dephospho-CoA kinase [Perkinsela sp. CCAP 1560/4]|eukprot:KNH08717.1 dephospho-CoA kinase [Perkinsela sp. CCAP 1560/4]
MFLIGLTGGIATGKSTVASIFRRKGAYIVDVDSIIRSLQEPNSRVTRKIVARWPQVGVASLGHVSIDRVALAKIVFENAHERKALERIMFLPTVVGIIKESLYGLLTSRGLVVVDHPYLYESRAISWMFAKVIVVWTPADLQRERLRQRNPTFSDQHIAHRIGNQIPLEEKIRLADILIDNSRSLRDAEQQVDKVYADILAMRRKVRMAILKTGAFMCICFLGWKSSASTMV